MNIIGFHNGSDSGAALLVNGKLIVAINEERLVRIKLYDGFPIKSINFLLKKANLKLNDIDFFSYGWFQNNNEADVLPRLCVRAMLNADDPKASAIIRKRLEVEYSQDYGRKEHALTEIKKMGVPEDKIKIIEHHKAHAWSAFASSLFSEALVVTSDARGDRKSITVCVANKKGVKEVDWLGTFDSLGYFYGQMTYYLGFTPHRHEGKVTGLAAFGDYSKTVGLMSKLVTWKHDQIFANIGKMYAPFFTNLSPGLKKELDKYKKEDIAAGVQYHVEYLIGRLIKKYLKKYPHKYICLAGGVFANVKVNQRILELKGVENIYVQPNMGDGGLALGSAAALNFEISGKPKIDMPNVYLGAEFTNDEILRELKKHDSLQFKKIKNKPKAVSGLIQKNKVVGLFYGRMEFGPRSLGNRSILYHSKDKSVNDWLNKRLVRTEFMPFAPVVIEELAPRCFIGWKKKHFCSHFMTVTYECTKEFKADSPAVVHIDGTARPQIVAKHENPGYYNIIKQYCKDTGQLSLINTSFNQHEEPIVCSPKDAISSLLKNCVDVLMIGDYMVEAVTES